MHVKTLHSLDGARKKKLDLDHLTALLLPAKRCCKGARAQILSAASNTINLLKF
jgi:hypothetical protein